MVYTGLDITLLFTVAVHLLYIFSLEVGQAETLECSGLVNLVDASQCLGKRNLVVGSVNVVNVDLFNTQRKST